MQMHYVQYTGIKLVNTGIGRDAVDLSIQALEAYERTCIRICATTL